MTMRDISISVATRIDAAEYASATFVEFSQLRLKVCKATDELPCERSLPLPLIIECASYSRRNAIMFSSVNRFRFIVRPHLLGRISILSAGNLQRQLQLTALDAALAWCLLAAVSSLT
jgi:hypothetical protein